MYIRASLVGILGISVGCFAMSANLQTIYVTASEHQSSHESSNASFALSAGHEYELNRMIRRAADSGSDVDVIFRDGTYRDVRMQILKQGIDTDAVYMLYPGVENHRDFVSIDGKPYHYFSTKQCNSDHTNCRVQAEDFALGPTSSISLMLRAEHSGKAIFDASSFQTANADIDNEAILIGGAYADVVQSGRQNIRSEHIKNVALEGLVFRNYRNGILVQHGLGITIDNCVVENIGTHAQKLQNDQSVGVSGFTANGNSKLVLVYNSVIRNVWNLQGNTEVSRDWPGLMHSIYDGDSQDIIFISNTISGSSGPMIKFGYYPTVKDGKILYQHGAQSYQRRGFFIQNKFVLTRVTDSSGPLPIYVPVQSFIHDNSEEKVGDLLSEPAKGMVFINNEFDNLLPESKDALVSFLRQEIPSQDVKPRFPDFFFLGNSVKGIAAQNLIVHRSRGTDVATRSIALDNPKSVESLSGTLEQQDGRKVNVNSSVNKLLSGPLRSPDSGWDTLIASVIAEHRIPYQNQAR